MSGHARAVGGRAGRVFVESRVAHGLQVCDLRPHGSGETRRRRHEYGTAVKKSLALLRHFCVGARQAREGERSMSFASSFVIWILTGGMVGWLVARSGG